MFSLLHKIVLGTVVGVTSGYYLWVEPLREYHANTLRDAAKASKPEENPK